LKDSWQ